ncbi:MAG: UDP-N-acetylmuramoyl-L-alanyl-D-glutamate--2,6-diaminopimelate ligase, partial [Actinobacteria bacterium]|nr:UDP-N-acetylmuramoyl-L-alanyl-D-glutamate--2,6-diaminopimelate ligase [Actinomycetota bacterium]NIS28876.1 UDP-N-acetylmuramoyl-L-alanyl-D-glutamate--2,6-diaminopimelate ligase [Actinomycetota bacterium]NIT97612.1 UDP-N-acetylmuramoyl-L-alanyl-D-glutamate--2,6-diaminopimelate ligase [Actinomycetota bacterium]NIU21268.1 UDP-N-acetylmuramoyl-L-alanyl-D-glutamate--2,6-diaminopimelate ligase [Actinomycetota bacterium]NIU64304.1 UDP-N-acetylmuramoyl-L-alanyl-D-glutamate--2,6-diaminopimelate ligas
MSVPLTRVAERVGGAPPAADPLITDVVHDSRRAGPGVLFACIPGSRADGHDFAAGAVEAGAPALLVERPLHLGVPEIVVARVRTAIGPAAAAVHGDPSRHLDLVGVTGTNGKTTTVHILAALMNNLGVRARGIGTLTGVRTTPEAPELQRQLAAAVAAGERVV